MTTAGWKTLTNLKKKTRPVLINLFGIAVIIYCLFPILWLFISSLKPKSELFDLPIRYFAQNPTFEYYGRLFGLGGPGGQNIANRLPFLIYLKNSFFVAGISVIIVVFLSAVAGYAFSRYHFRGRNGLLLSLIVTRMLPGPAIMLPVYVMISKLGLIDNLWSLILVHTVFGLPMGIWLSTSFIDNIPIELEEAAIIDGCSRVGAFFRIILPLGWIGLATVGIFHFLGSWSEFAFASILIESQKLRTAPVGLAEFIFNIQSAQFNQIGAAAITMSLPLIVLFMMIQKQFVRGFVSGSVKG